MILSIYQNKTKAWQDSYKKYEQIAKNPKRFGAEWSKIWRKRYQKHQMTSSELCDLVCTTCIWMFFTHLFYIFVNSASNLFGFFLNCLVWYWLLIYRVVLFLSKFCTIVSVKYKLLSMLASWVQWASNILLDTQAQLILAHAWQVTRTGASWGELQAQPLLLLLLPPPWWLPCHSHNDIARRWWWRLIWNVKMWNIHYKNIILCAWNVWTEGGRWWWRSRWQ